MSTAISIRTSAEQTVGSRSSDLTIEAPTKTGDARPMSPMSPPLTGLDGACLEPAVKQQGQELRQMVSMKTGVPVMISAGERRLCYGVCADDMLAPQEQFDAIKVYGLLREARALALRKKAARVHHLRTALEAAGYPETAGPHAMALATDADEAEAAYAAEEEFWKQTRREVTTLLKNGTPAMAIICQFSAERIFLH